MVARLLRCRGVAGAVGAIALVALGTASPGLASAQGPPPFGGPPGGFTARALGLGGDFPLTTVEAFEGRVEVVVAAEAFDRGTGISGSFSVSGIPTGATILRAWLILTDWAASSPTGTFAGSPLPAPAATASDAPLIERRHDVTASVTGNGGYAYNITGFSNCYGAALVVVYQYSSLPLSRVVINDGAEDLQNATSSTSFGGFASPGAGRLIVFTQADDTGYAPDDQDEALAFNGTTILGPGAVYSQNVGPYASLITRSVTVAAGTNTAAVTTGADQFGLHLAVLIALQEAPVIPLLSRWGIGALTALLVVAGAALLLRRH